MGSFLVGRGQKRENRPVELCFVGLNDRTLVGSVTFDYILKLSFDLFRLYIVLYFLAKIPQLLPTYHEIRGVVGSQRGAYFHWSVSTSLQNLLTNLNTSVVDLLYFRRPVEEALKINPTITGVDPVQCWRWPWSVGPRLGGGQITPTRGTVVEI